MHDNDEHCRINLNLVVIKTSKSESCISQATNIRH